MTKLMSPTLLPLDIIVIGCGTVGSALLRQLERSIQRLAEQGIGLRVVAIANRRCMLVDTEGLSLASWKASLASGTKEPGNADKTSATSLEALMSLGALLANPVLVDCTASDAIPSAYPGFLAAGFNIVTPNKRGNTSSMEHYKAMRTLARTQNRLYLYEATVGAGLPVIDNFKKLLLAGDKLVRFQGILSGSLSFMLGELETGRVFSAVVREAMDKGFTEPDPRDDLSGIDVARKVLILARECGLSLELADIELDGLVPPEYMALGKDEFISRMGELDGHFEAIRAKARTENKVPRFAGSIEGGKGRAGLLFVGPDHPLYPIKGGENALAFHTRYYDPIPLIIRGYGAGAEVTAAGVFSDILRTVNWKRIP
ncbi:MAG: hypothetical protein RBT62_06395 [Spirochaetia bacterium]|nr:hypothetical protein [Spirochaetia bacterium]